MDNDLTINEYANEVVSFIEDEKEFLTKKVYYDITICNNILYITIYYDYKKVFLTILDFNLIGLEMTFNIINNLFKEKDEVFVTTVSKYKYWFHIFLIKLDNLFNKNRHTF